ncbi:MAG: YbhB/YbcL family Raf kinase inhibitor-like protein [Planctomycetota bacterium]|nr:YbhB/YbcL family Raf kinase inhibitor-like protein [Planctomycetota bacterium]MDA1106450.1 YbhB/YbcL family Raf kinase inhibitor-like protein [Planctomycetota bacterium]
MTNQQWSLASVSIVCVGLACVAHAHRQDAATASFTASSPAWNDGARIPDRHTVEGDDVSPAISWNHAPEGTKSFAIVCADPDVKRKGGWVHWVIWNIPGDATGIVESIKRDLEPADPKGARQGQTSWGKRRCGYCGPATPEGVGNHTYIFSIFALDTVLDVEAGATERALQKAMEGHVLGTATLKGTFSRGEQPQAPIEPQGTSTPPVS